jgi:precorrin-8X/cobalt-precorrin-8 methylmutase
MQRPDAMKPARLVAASVASESGRAGLASDTRGANPAADTDYAIVLAGHGSRDPDGIREFEALLGLVRERAPRRIVRHGYLEFASPTIDVAVRSALDAGARHVVMVPGVLLAATHAKNDMPSELLALQREFPDAKFSFGAALDVHPKLLQLCAQRIVEAEARGGELVPRGDACLVVVGRGTSDPDANADIAKIARMLEEGLGFGTSLVCYAGTAKPKVADGLRAAARLGYRRLVVLPYFLFDGVLVKRIYAASAELRARYASLDVLDAGYLGAHEHVADVFIERAQQGAEGIAAMNCALCKYRVQIVGFEQQVGTPQRAHHLKVRGAAGGDGAAPLPPPAPGPYEPHPIEAQSMRIIDAGRDWSGFPAADARVLKRLVHTSGDFDIVDDIFISAGASDIGMRALLRCRRVVTDVTMVQAGLKQALLAQLEIDTWCGVHDDATRVLAQTHGLTRSAAGIRRAWQMFGNDAIVAIGDAPTAVMETITLIEQHGWRPQLVIGLPVGFVGTRECKDALRDALQVPRITNRGTRGGSPWAASVVNALMIGAIDALGAAENSEEDIR